MKNFILLSIVAIVSLSLGAIGLEVYLERLGYGNPPLYRYDPCVGYVLQSSQDVRRVRGCRVHINNLGMRSPDTTAIKPDDIYRVLVAGDSLVFGGSYIDQEDTFCYVAEKDLNAHGKRFEILNAGVNGYGPQNVQRYLETRGTYDSNLVIVFFPWGDLQRDFSSFYTAPFWSNSPGWATGEFFRHASWMVFGMLSRKWKDINLFENQAVLTRNLAALAAIKSECDQKKTRVLFLWSHLRDVLLGCSSDIFACDAAEVRKTLPRELLVDLGTIFQGHGSMSSLYEDGLHYSSAGHHFVGTILADLVRAQEKASRHSVLSHK